MKNIITSAIVGLLLISGIIYAETVDEVAQKMHSPADIEKFYADGGFRSEYKIPDYAKAPEETLDSRYGDCKDFAILTQAILKAMGISSRVIYIQFVNNKFGHAICAWKEGKYYDYFDVTKLVHTKYTTIDDLVDNSYLDAETCSACKMRMDIATGKYVPKDQE